MAASGLIRRILGATDFGAPIHREHERTAGSTDPVHGLRPLPRLEYNPPPMRAIRKIAIHKSTLKLTARFSAWPTKNMERSRRHIKAPCAYRSAPARFRASRRAGSRTPCTKMTCGSFPLAHWTSRSIATIRARVAAHRVIQLQRR